MSRTDLENTEEVAAIYVMEVPIADDQQALPLYEIRGTQIFRSAWHPEGRSSLPVLEIRGNQVFATVWNGIE